MKCSEASFGPCLVKTTGNPELVLCVQTDDCCDMSLKCEFYLNSTVVASKIMSYEQTHASPMPLISLPGTLTTPRSLFISRPLSHAADSYVLLPEHPTGNSDSTCAKVD